MPGFAFDSITQGETVNFRRAAWTANSRQFPVVSHVWMAPDLQEICYARLGRLRSCVRPIDAIGYGPLALMGSADRGLISLSGLMSH